MKATEFFRRGAGDRVDKRRGVGQPRGVDERQGVSQPRGVREGQDRPGRWTGTAGQPGPLARTTTLILVDPDDPGYLSGRPDRVWSHLFVRVLSSSLDRQLARGHPPESGRLLAARAQMLVSLGNRRTLAQSFDNLMAHARHASSTRGPRIPMNRSSIIACERDIQQVRDALLTSLPTPARGAAMASVLLGDGTGPLFDRRRAVELRSTLRETIAQLDPSTAL